MKKLLLVDNSSVILNVLKDLFSEDKDFKVFTAKSFEEAKSLISKKNFFAAVSNIVLPDALNGETLTLLKEQNIPTVVLTSNIDDNVINKSREASVVDYVSKDSLYELEYVCNLIKLLTFIDGIEVLVVEDSNVVASKIKDILESLLLKVHVSKNGKCALEKLQKNSNISLIVSDYNMDEMDGLKFVKEARKIECYSSVPIMIMTSESDDNLKIKFFKNGITDFLTKPVLTEELKAKIVNIFSNKKYISDIQWFNKVVDENVITSSTDEHGTIKHVSKAFCTISGYDEEELIGQNHRILRHPDMPKSLFQDLWSTITSGKQWTGEVKNLRKDGDYYWVSVLIEPNFDNSGNITGFTSLRQDITDKKRIYELSIVDALTSLYNRRHFNDTASSMLENTLRDSKVFGFVLLDIDNFKKYNDTYGHQAGDDVLKNIGTSLKKSFKREEDIVFRLGGEEFGVVLCAKTKDDIVKLAEEARKNIEEMNILHEPNIPFKRITASFGVTILENKNDLEEELNMDAIYKLSDYYLYRAKELGRNRVEYKKR